MKTKKLKTWRMKWIGKAFLCSFLFSSLILAFSCTKNDVNEIDEDSIVNYLKFK